MKDRVHKQNFDESVSKLKTINQKILDVQADIQEVEEDNELMWNEIKALNEVIPKDQLKDIAVLDRCQFYNKKEGSKNLINI